MKMSTTAKTQGNQAKEQAGQAVDKLKDAAGHAGEAVSSAASAVGQKAGEVASAVGHKAEDATAAVGSGMQGLAGQVRDSGPQSGMLGTASRTVADGLEGAGQYLQDKNLSGMMDDITGLIKRNPVPAVLLALGIGFLVGRVLTPSSSSTSRSWS
jgi:ElaB/YqjD/DUF883 family membrane-anchored ribosome-binding protein